MLTRVFSAAIQGVDAVEVEVEINAGSGAPQVVIVEPIFDFLGECFPNEIQRQL